jgi:uncharacterized protein (TIGR03435 family)
MLKRISWLPLAVAIAAAQTATTPKFKVASIKRCVGNSHPLMPVTSSPGRVTLNCINLMGLINQSYVVYANGSLHLPGGRLVPVEKGPAWINSDLYTIEAKADGTPSQGMMLGPTMQALLEDRFRLRLHSETRAVPVYSMTLAKGGPKLAASREGSCRPLDLLHPPPPSPPGQARLPPCKIALITTNGVELYGATMAELGAQLSMRLGRDIIDNTGIPGTFDVRVTLPPDLMRLLGAPPPPPLGVANPDIPAEPSDSLYAAQAIAQKLGLKLESAQGPGRFLVIDHVERPSEN